MIFDGGQFLIKIRKCPQEYHSFIFLCHIRLTWNISQSMNLPACWCRLALMHVNMIAPTSLIWSIWLSLLLILFGKYSIKCFLYTWDFYQPLLLMFDNLHWKQWEALVIIFQTMNLFNWIPMIFSTTEGCLSKVTQIYCQCTLHLFLISTMYKH